MIVLLIVIFSVLIFFALNLFYDNRAQCYDQIANSLIRKKYNDQGCKVIELIEAQNLDELPFKSNQFKVVLNPGIPFVREYYYLVRYTEKAGLIRESWVNLNLLFGNPVSFVIKERVVRSY